MSPTNGRKLIIHCRTQAVEQRMAPWPPTPPVPGVVHLWWSTLERLRPARESWQALLDPTEHARAVRFRAERDRERFILGHGLLRRVLGHYLGHAPQEVRITRGVHGKPFVKGSPLAFNFSDTKDAVLVGITTGSEIGVDLESDLRVVDHEAVSAHYFTRPEIGAIATAGEGARKRFLQLWTRKEAVLKASGVGIMEDLRSLRVDAARNTVVIAHEAFVRMAAKEYHVVSMEPGPEHVASVALPVAPVELIWRDAAQWAS